MKYDYHIIVIGAGSAGLVVASGAAGIGAKVALIESDKMGGDCLNAGCVPSKTFLKSAHLAKDINNANKFALSASLENIDCAKVMARVQAVIKDIEPHDSKVRYESLGVKVFQGKGKLISKHQVKAGEKTISGKYIVIATGSEPAIPEIKGLDKINYLTNRSIFNLQTLPKHLIVLGAGPIGCELGQGFCHLGSEVTLIQRSLGLFKKDDPEVGSFMQKIFQEDKIQLKLGYTPIQIKKNGKQIIILLEDQNGKHEEIIGDQLLVSTGRKPVSYDLGLEELGIIIDKRGNIETNNKLQTKIKNIFAAGDVTGPYQFTHMAGYQAGIVIKNTIFKMSSKVDYSCVPWTTYTKPEVAHIGYTEPLAQSLGIYQDSITIDLNKIDRAKAENDTQGFLKLNLGKKNRIIGATLIGEKAGEMIPVITLAIKQKLKASTFLNIIFSYPTEAEIFKFASLELTKISFKPWMKKIIQKILL